MEKNYYKVLGISFAKLAKYNSIEDVNFFDIVGPGLETITDAINYRKKCFEDYPGYYFTIRKRTADECFITMNAAEVDNIINSNKAE